jgi:hypothetical protein
MTVRLLSVGWRRWSPGAWTLAGVAAGAFGPRPQFTGMRSVPLRVLFFVQFVVGERRADEAGTAVAGLSGASRRPLLRGSLAATGIAVVVIALLATLGVTWPVWAVFVVAAWAYWPMTRHGMSEFGARRALKRCKPYGPVVTVHTVASSRRGAGARLLQQVTGEADRKEWTLFLVAANERLGDYYGQFGFAPTGLPVALPSGESAVPMARIPPRRDCGDG